MTSTISLRGTLLDHFALTDPAPGEEALYYALQLLVGRDDHTEVATLVDVRTHMIRLGDLLTTARSDFTDGQGLLVRTERALRETLDQLGHAVDRACTELSNEGELRR